MGRGIRLIFPAMILVLLFPLALWAGVTGKIAGEVRDRETGDPLPGVNVVIRATTMGAATNLEGQYFIINVDVGTYTVEASMMGYKVMEVNNVKVSVDLTTRVDFTLEPTVLDVTKVVEVRAERPMIQEDVTSSVKIISAETMETIPIDDAEDMLTLTAGAVEDAEGDIHMRGGRAREILYMVDGAAVMDPLTGAFDSDIPELAVEEASVMTGGFGAEYGNAQSGIVSWVTREGGSSHSGKVRFKSSAFGGYREALRNWEFSMGGPEPLSKSLLKLPGKMNYFFSGEITKTHGGLPHDDEDLWTVQGKLTYKPSANYKVSFSGFLSENDYTYFDNLWKRTVYEDRNESYENRIGNDWYIGEDIDHDGVLDPGEDQNGNGRLDQWYGNGNLDTEDVGKDGIPNTGDEGEGNNWVDSWPEEGITEDLNGNGILDFEDLDHNKRLDYFNMLDHLPFLTATSNQLSVNWTQTLSPRTFYEFKVNRFFTDLHYEDREIINEDRDGDGHLDQYNELYLDPQSGTYIWRDLNEDGNVDRGNEDLNGNDILDRYGVDLFTDRNRNGYVDASEEAYPNDPDRWLAWDDVERRNAKDRDGFYTYGQGLTYDRSNYHDDEKTIWSARLDITSQVTTHHQFKAGIEGKYYDMMNYDAPDPYGYAEYYHIYPNEGAFYVQDKMEYPGLIVNVGIRYDRFDANWDNFPGNVSDPTWDQLDEGFNPEEHTVGEIKNPTSVPVRSHWSPRLGVSHPITDRDKLHFTYGRYFQVPQLRFAFMNLNYNMGGGFPLVGNPTLEPERTTSYELGIEHQLSGTMVLDMTGFYKDISGLTDTRQVYYNPRDWYGQFVNLDYGNVRGFELTLTRRPSHYIAGEVTYTYQVAKGKSSSTSQGYITAWAGNIEPKTESYLDWDQRHTVNFNLDVRSPVGERLWGVPLTEDFGVNFVWRYGSGTRWTPPSDEKLKKYNTEVMPYTMEADIKIDKGFRWNRWEPRVFLEVHNLFNRKNVLDLDDEEWYQTFGDPDGKYDDPEVYSVPRVMRLGASLGF